MRCPFCRSKKLVKAGRLRSYNNYNKQRYKCNNCGRFTVKPKKDKA